MVQTWVLNSNAITLLVKKEKKKICRKTAKVNTLDPCVELMFPGWELELRLQYAPRRSWALCCQVLELRVLFSK